jgi:hypothetical protein
VPNSKGEILTIQSSPGGAEDEDLARSDFGNIRGKRKESRLGLGWRVRDGLNLIRRMEMKTG